MRKKTSYKLIKIEPSISSSLKPFGEIHQAMRNLQWNRITYSLIGFSCMLVFSGMIRAPLPLLGNTLNACLILFLLLFYIAIIPYPLALLTRFTARRNIPVASSHIALFLLASNSELVLYAAFNISGHIWGDLPLRILRRSIYNIGITVPLYVYFKEMVCNRISNRPDLVPYFTPVRPGKIATVPASLLDTTLKGEIFAIKAANQYIEIHTNEGPHLIRMTLKEAEQHLSGDAGLRVHRSWWISMPELASARLGDDQQKIISAAGREYPIGPTRLQDIKAALS